MKAYLIAVVVTILFVLALDARWDSIENTRNITPAGTPATTEGAHP